jgi:hypothetical protein
LQPTNIVLTNVLHPASLLSLAAGEGHGLEQLVG